MSSITFKGFAILFLASIVLIVASAVPAPLGAREPGAGIISILDNSVGGEPGEDPHLRSDPGARAQCIWEQGGYSENREAGEESMRRVDGRHAIEGMPSGLLSRSKWRIIFKIWILSII